MTFLFSALFLIVLGWLLYIRAEHKRDGYHMLLVIASLGWGGLTLMIPAKKEFVGKVPTIQAEWDGQKYESVNPNRSFGKVDEFAGFKSKYKCYSIFGFRIDDQYE